MVLRRRERTKRDDLLQKREAALLAAGRDESTPSTKEASSLRESELTSY